MPREKGIAVRWTHPIGELAYYQPREQGVPWNS